MGSSVTTGRSLAGRWLYDHSTPYFGAELGDWVGLPRLMRVPFRLNLQSRGREGGLARLVSIADLEGLAF